MKIISLLLNIAVITATFCTPLQQSFAQTVSKGDSVTREIADSDTFYREMMRYTPPKQDNTARAQALLKQMTLEEKVGQMTQLTMGMFVDGRDQDVRIDEAKLDKAINKYGVGSFLNVNDQALTIDKWHEIIGRIQEVSMKTRLKIPNLYGIDSVHGANYVRGATLFPQEIGMAATWNPALMHRAAEITAAETRAAAIPWSFSPVLDIGRQPLWARFLGNLRRRPVFGESVGRVVRARFGRRRREQSDARCGVSETLYGLQSAAVGTRPHRCADSRKLSARICRTDVHRRF